MASQTTKRKLPQSKKAGAHANAIKRRKIAGKRNGVSGESNDKVGADAIGSQQARVVHLDELKWQEVGMPDQMEDYEGFFGLEEVEGVDVVKEDETGRVSFRTMESDIGAKDASNTYDMVKEGLKSRKGEVAADEEWTGFGDEAPALVGEKAGGEAPIQLKEKANKRSKRGKKAAVPDETPSNEQSTPPTDNANVDNEISGAEELGQNPFAGLLEEDNGEGDTDISAWQELDLSPDTLTAISRLGFSRPTLIQQRAIPEIIDGHDVIGKAATGSGKTLAFGIPILEYFLGRPKMDIHIPTALILAPTRELAHQIDKHLTSLCVQDLANSPRIATITGGLSVQKQKRLLQTADIMIGTPGRLWEVMESSVGLIESLKQIRFLVIDEADRLLSEGHFKEAQEILDALDRVNQDEDVEEKEEAVSNERQTLVFSATFHKGLQQKLNGKHRPMTEAESVQQLLNKLNFREEKPKFIDVNPVKQMATGLKEGLVECAGTEKDLYLYALLLLHPQSRTLVFTNSISAVRRITPFLQNLNLPVHALHSNMPQKSRLRAIERFTSSNTGILIATDIAARGLDIPGVNLVIHYHVPRAADMYIHRSGRTARAEEKGSSILICSPDEVNGVRRLIAKVHAKKQEGGDGKRVIRTLDIDRRIVGRLKPRASLAKKIADVTIAKEKGNSKDQLFAQAAEDLGVDYDSEELDALGGGGKSGRGNARKAKERSDRVVGKQEVASWKTELRILLQQRVNTGVSAKYLTGNVDVDIDALLRGEKGEFLGHVGLLGEDSGDDGVE